jgi:FNIP Repeat
MLVVSNDIKLYITGFLSDIDSCNYFIVSKNENFLQEKFSYKSYIKLNQVKKGKIIKLFLNELIENFPNTLTSLTFGAEFNQTVDNLPKNLTSLIFGAGFNQTVNNLPNTLTSLNFGYYFNQTVNNLPNTLTSLNFGYKFNQTVDNLPKTLTSLKYFRSK